MHNIIFFHFVLGVCTCT